MVFILRYFFFLFSLFYFCFAKSQDTSCILTYSEDFKKSFKNDSKSTLILADSIKFDSILMNDYFIKKLISNLRNENVSKFSRLTFNFRNKNFQTVGYSKLEDYDKVFLKFIKNNAAKICFLNTKDNARYKIVFGFLLDNDKGLLRLQIEEYLRNEYFDIYTHYYSL